MIETLQDLNDQTCCCDLTLCPVPVMECESMSGSATCPAAPDPPEEEGENETITYGCYVPFVAPEGDGDTELTVYKKLSTLSESDVLTGKYASFYSYAPTADPSEAVRDLSTVVNWPGTTTEKDWFQEGFDPYEIVFTTDTYDTIAGVFFDATWVDGDPAASCEMTATVRTVSEGIEESINGDPDSIPTTTSLVDGTPPTIGFNGEAWDLTRVGAKATQTLTQPLTKADMIAAAMGEMPEEFPDPPEGDDCAASKIVVWPKKGDYTFPACGMATAQLADDLSASITKVRARFKIPATWADQVTGLTVPFTGTYFKITYDIIEEPTGWDDAVPTVFRSFFLEDQVLTPWIGPGTGAPDDPSWFTDWITLDPPTVPGVRRIVNIRFVCRENWFIGEVPQVTGDAVTLPDP